MKKIIVVIIFICILGSVSIYMLNRKDKINANKDNTEDPIVENQNLNMSNTSNQRVPTVKLNSGYDMPVLGIGTYSLHNETCVNSIYTAIQCGYRKIDTAYMYGNEEEVGEAVRKAITNGLIERNDIFVATKLYPDQFDNPEEAIEQALEKLDIEYIDLMLLHLSLIHI